MIQFFSSPNILLTILLIYLALISIVAIFVTVFDKLRAKHHGWRVRESTLLIISLLGGSAAMYLTMLIISHKTRKAKFMVGIPVIMLVQIAAAIIIWRIIHA